MNILVLHGLGLDLNLARGTSVAHLRSFQQHAPEHRYLYQDVNWPVTGYLRDFPFDLILIDGTFLCWRWVRPRELLAQLLEQYAWVADHPAVKIAFPQDDYDHAHILDRWLSDWKVDHVYAVCPQHMGATFPQLSRRPGLLSVALTGYVEDGLATAPASAPIDRRSLLVGYRARNLPAWYGSFGRMKALLGDRFARSARDRALSVDISTNERDLLLGAAWTRFLSDSRFTLGCESGSSLLDPEGHIRDAVEDYLRKRPAATFEEIAGRVFPGEDRKHVFSTVSPRVFEAAALGSCQILLEGNYLPEMRPGVHYIELRQDYSNVNEVLDQLSDTGRAQAMADACHEAIIQPATYHYSTRVREVLARVAAIQASSKPAPGAPSCAFDRMVHDHQVAASALHPAQVEIRALRSELGDLRRATGRPLRQRVLSRIGRTLRRGSAS